MNGTTIALAKPRAANNAGSMPSVRTADENITRSKPKMPIIAMVR
jgi:hypothetical protein